MAKIILEPGHGLNAKGFWQRPLITTKKNKVIVINKFNQDPRDETEGYYREDIGTLEISKHCRDYLVAAGHEVWLTRTGYMNSAEYLKGFLTNTTNGRKLPESSRNWQSHRWIIELQRHVKPDVFVSVHTNAAGGRGSIAFWPGKAGKPLAENIVSQLTMDHSLRNRGTRKHRYLVLRNIFYSCLVECCFHDNYEDLQLLLKNKKGIGESVAKGIIKSFRS